MSADDHVDIGDRAGEQFILGVLFYRRGAGVGEADDEVDLLLLPEDRRHLFSRFDGIGEGDRFGERGIGLGVLAEDAEQADSDAAPFDDRVGFDGILPKRRPEVAVPLAVRAEDDVGGDHDGEPRFRGAGNSERFRQACQMEIEIVVSEGHRVVPHRCHEPQFRRLLHEGRVEEGPHAEVARVEKERPVAFAGADLPDQRHELRVAAPFGRRAAGHCHALGEKIGMQIVREQDDEPFAGRGPACGHIRPGNAGEDQQKDADRKDRPTCRETVMHGTPPLNRISRFLSPSDPAGR